MPTTFTIDENATVIVEFPEKSGLQPVSRLSPREVARKSSEALDQAMNTIHHMARRVNATLNAMAEPPEQVEVDFGITFDADVGAVIARDAAECSISVKLVWEHGAQAVD